MKLISTSLVRAFFSVVMIMTITSSNTLQAQVCASPNNIFGLNGNGSIYNINTTNAHVGTKVNAAAYSGATPNQANGMGYNNVNGKFYYFKVNPGAGSQEFISYDPVADKYKNLTPSPITATVHAGCVSFNGTGYYCTDVTGKLYYYNISTDKWFTITSTIKDQFGNNISTLIVTQNSGDMAIDGVGNLWIITSSATNYGLYEIVAPLPTTAVASVTAKQVIAPTSVTPTLNSFQGIAFNASGFLYVATSDDKLYLMKNKTSLSLVGTLTTTGVGNDLTSCSFPMSVLPVTWESFSASLVKNNSVDLKWSVSQQVNNKGFDVEHSTDGINWTSIGFVYSNTQSEASTAYAFTDGNPSAGKNYYRLQQQDYDGNVLYSEIKIISIETTNAVAIWPNPAHDQVQIQLPTEETGKLQTSIFDLSGRTVLQTTLHAGVNSVTVNTLPAGTYIVHITTATGKIINQKLNKQ